MKGMLRVGGLLRVAAPQLRAPAQGRRDSRPRDGVRGHAGDAGGTAGLGARGGRRGVELRSDAVPGRGQRVSALSHDSPSCHRTITLPQPLTSTPQALYVRFLRARLVEAQLSGHRLSQGAPLVRRCVATSPQPHAHNPSPFHPPDDARENTPPNAGESAAAFSFERTKEAIQKAVREAGALDEPERARRIKQLRLRWHPGALTQAAVRVLRWPTS